MWTREANATVIDQNGKVIYFGLERFVRDLLDRAGGSWRLLKGVLGAVTVPGDYLLSKLPVGVLQAPRTIRQRTTRGQECPWWVGIC